MKYANQQQPKKRWPKRLIMLFAAGIILLAGATIAVRYAYYANLKPRSVNTEVRLITIDTGASVETIGNILQKEKIIRSAWAFRLYVSSREVGGDLKAGSYELASSQSVPEIVAQLTGGKVATDLVTILPGQRLDQIRKHFIQDGFSEQDVDKALDPQTYANHPALVDKPKDASLEGYLYPDSYQKTASTSAQSIVEAALDQMNTVLVPDLRSAFVKQGLGTYQAIVLASVVEKEVSRQQDRDQVAQVFLARLRIGMRLQSDATASYGAILAGQKPSPSFVSAYNTYQNVGLPPTPISNVTGSSLRAVAHPAETDWLYFVSGDDGATHFAKTLADQEANIRRYCSSCNF